MVVVKYKFYSHGKNAKVFTQNVKTQAQANDIKRQIGKSGSVEIIRLRKKSTRRNSNAFGFSLPKFKF